MLKKDYDLGQILKESVQLPVDCKRPFQVKCKYYMYPFAGQKTSIHLKAALILCIILCSNISLNQKKHVNDNFCHEGWTRLQ